MDSRTATIKTRKYTERWKIAKLAYKCGSYFAGCRACGETEILAGTTREVWRSGTDVWRSYQPEKTGWSYYCWSCGAKDEECRPGARMDSPVFRPKLLAGINYFTRKPDDAPAAYRKQTDRLPSVMSIRRLV